MAENPNDPIIFALESDNPEAAEHLCREQLARTPDVPDVSVLLAVSLWRQGRRDDALAEYDRLTHLYPGVALHWINLGAARWDSGDLHSAEQAFKTAVSLTPDDADLLDRLGLLQMDMGEAAAARDTLLRAFGQAPDSPGIRIHAARACSACRDSRAEHLLATWREWLPLDPRLQYELADVHAQLGEVPIATELLEDLARNDPGEWRIRLRLANLYERLNRLEEARSVLDGVVRDSAGTPTFPAGEVAHQRAQLALRDGDYATARDLLEQAGPLREADFAHWFILAAARDRLGDTAGAMQALERGHAGQIKELRHLTPNFFDADAEVLPKVSARVNASDYRAWPALQAPEKSQSPVFVVGFPRSGTTLLEQMLDAHPALQSMDERPFFNSLSHRLEQSVGIEVPKDLVKLDQRDCDELRKGYLLMACAKVPRRWDARLVDKNPLNMLWLPLIHRLFPHAQFILAVRHPCDVILSCYMQNFRTAVLAVAGQSLEHLARAYVDAMDSWLHHVEVFKPDVFVSHYEHLVADTPGQLRSVAQFLELDDADAMLNFDARAREKGYIKTPSYTQVIEPINRRGIGRWQRYREYFEPVLPILQPLLDHWGYSAGPENSAGL